MTFADDERGQPVVIGALLIFTILILAFAGYQAFAVPQQNAETEFQHEQQVQSEFLDIRNDILQSATGGTSSFSELTLGTDYTARLLALNPPPATGTVETTASQQISVEDGGTDITGDVCRGPDETRSLEYRASYNEFRGYPTYRIENTVAYRQFDNTARPQSAQRLISDASINLVPIQGEFSESGIQAESIEPVPGRVKAQTVTDPVIELPTELDQATWNELLADELDSGESATVSGDTLTLDLSGEYNLVCSPVGINTAPPGGARNEGGLSGGTGDNGQINPSGAQDIFLTDISRQGGGGSSNIEFRFENRGSEDRTFEQARYVLYYASNEKAQQDVEIGGDTLQLRGEYVTLSNPIKIGAGDTETVVLDFDDNAAGDLIGISFIDDRNEESLYLGGSDSSGGSGGSGGGTVPAGSGFNSVSASDFNAQNNRDQSLSFELSDQLSSGETVEIDLSEAVNGGVGYSNPTVVSGGNGDVSLNGNVVTYNSNGDPPSTTVSISIEADANKNEGTYTAYFSHSDKIETASNSFTVG
ncbi:hypothetical protein [Natronomonas gomsonensis]|uniref:hypothetical protein n=1 Tax=Natronomonas gomsonensis TaxID=1046043 RepID=UPI0015BE63AE|nr:hypothetical protein [Natronomonas gomsonensis]